MGRAVIFQSPIEEGNYEGFSGRSRAKGSQKSRDPGFLNHRKKNGLCGGMGVIGPSE